MFRIPPRLSEVQELRREVAALRRELAALSRQMAAIPQPERESWERHSAPELDMPLPFPVDEQPSPLLQLLFSSKQSA